MQAHHLNAFVLLVFSAAWLISSQHVAEERRAVLHWATYGLLQLLAVAAAVLPPSVSSWAAATLALTGFVVALRGVDIFLTGRSSIDYLYAALLGIYVTGLIAALVLDLTPAQSRILRLSVQWGSIIALLIGTVPYFWRLFRRGCSRTVSTLALMPSMLVGTVQAGILGWSIFVGPLANSFPKEQVTLFAAAVSVLSTLLFNLCFLFLLVARLLDRLRHNATHDPLTKVGNRMLAQTALADAFERHRRGGEGFAVVMVDIDHFKRVNDTFGHAGGDRGLAFVADVLRKGTRPYDTVARWGGEEFILVLLGVNTHTALERIENLRRQIEALSTTTLGHPLTASFGIAAANGVDADAAAVVSRADDALYRAKRDGRNRVRADLDPGVCSAPSLVGTTMAPAGD